MNKRRIIIALILSGTLVAVLFSQIRTMDVVDTLVSIDPLYLAAGFVLYSSTYFFRALRFHVLLNRKVSVSDLFKIICVHNMANSILPARTGELSYIYLVKRRGISAGEGIATLMAARMFDVIVISLMFFVSAVSVSQLPTLISDALLTIAFFLVIVTLFLFSLVYGAGKFFGLVERITERFDLNRYKIISLLLEKLGETAKNFETLKSKKIVYHTFLISILVWYPIYLTSYILLVAMGLNLDIWVVILGSTFTLMSALLPIYGLVGFGTYEGTWALAFMALGFSKEIAISSGFGVHIISIVYFLILGFYGMWKLRFRNLRAVLS